MEPFWHRRIATRRGRRPRSPRASSSSAGRASTHLVMAHVRAPDRLVDTSAVREVALDALVEPHTRVTLAESYGSLELAEQLFARETPDRRRGPDALLRDRASRATIAAYCELRSDGATAQIEDVNTLDRLPRPRPRPGRRAARARPGAAAHDLVFIEALADDWPKELYVQARLRDRRRAAPVPAAAACRSHACACARRGSSCASRPIAELRELEQVAEAGIHDPGFMPFGIAWTDSLDEESFLDWHRARCSTMAAGQLAPRARHLRRRPADRLPGPPCRSASERRAGRPPAPGSVRRGKGEGSAPRCGRRS